MFVVLYLLADVLSIEDLVADFTLEAAQVPVLVQCYKGLFILKLLPTAAAVCTQDRKRKGNQLMRNNTEVDCL